MGFIIKNTAGLINTRITDTGRQLLSQGNFNISYFQVGDSEVCYNCAGSVQPSTGFVLEPSFNAQNSTGSPQSNRENIKYPFYFQGTSGSTYGIPFVGSINTDVYNHTGTLGFFTGNTSAPIVYTAQTSSAYTITSNLIIDYGECVSASTIDLTFDSCAPTTGTPSVGDIVTIIYDGNAGCGDISGNYPILTYKIQAITGSTPPFTVQLDRALPDFINQPCAGFARTLIYPSGMTPFYDVVVPTDYFLSACSQTDEVLIWNMNIPWSESPAGVIDTINEDYTQYGSVNYLGTKEYLGYQSVEGQYFANSTGLTANTDTFYYNSYDEPILVFPEYQKAIAIVSYTNQSINNYYGEKFAFQPYDPASPGAVGQARNFKVTVPTLMWHKTTGTTIGQTFYVDPQGYDLFYPNYMKSKKDNDFNTPGMRYYNLWDTNPDSNGNLNRVGKVFPDSELIVFDDDEIVAAMSYKSNRNWTLPAPKLGLIPPNICNTGLDTTGILSADTEYLWVTYRFNSTAFTDSLHCNYYSKIQGPSLDCSLTPQNVTVRFGNEFPFMTQECSGFSANKLILLAQKTIGDVSPDPAQWVELDVTSELAGTTIDNYLTPSGLTGTTFTISLDDYTGGTIYDLNQYIDIPMNGETNKLNFGDEYFFYGNIDTDIQATIYEMRYAVNLTDNNFVNSSNPTYDPTIFNPRYITEIGLYNSDNDLMILSKLQSPVLRQGLQNFLIKFDF
jgi:hypothetical protein